MPSVMAGVRGEANIEGTALSCLRGYVNAASKGLDVAADHIHSYPPPGNISDLAGGGELRGKNL